MPSQSELTSKDFIVNAAAIERKMSAVKTLGQQLTGRICDEVREKVQKIEAEVRAFKTKHHAVGDPLFGTLTAALEKNLSALRGIMPTATSNADSEENRENLLRANLKNVTLAGPARLLLQKAKACTTEAGGVGRDAGSTRAGAAWGTYLSNRLGKLENPSEPMTAKTWADWLLRQLPAIIETAERQNTFDVSSYRDRLTRLRTYYDACPGNLPLEDRVVLVKEQIQAQKLQNCSGHQERRQTKIAFRNGASRLPELLPRPQDPVAGRAHTSYPVTGPTEGPTRALLRPDARIELPGRSSAPQRVATFPPSPLSAAACHFRPAAGSAATGVTCITNTFAEVTAPPGILIGQHPLPLFSTIAQPLPVIGTYVNPPPLQSGLAYRPASRKASPNREDPAAEGAMPLSGNRTRAGTWPSDARTRERTPIPVSTSSATTQHNAPMSIASILDGPSARP